MTTLTYVIRNGQRYRVGECHGRSTIPEALVQRILDLSARGYGRRRIYCMLHLQGTKISEDSVRSILNGRRRGILPQIVVDDKSKP